MKVYIKNSKIHGIGVFASKNINKDEVVEICPVIILNPKDTSIVDGTSLFDYYFSWGEDDISSAIALGYGSIYNHSYKPCAEYGKDCLKKELTFTAIKRIKKDEEITVNYNGLPDSQEKLWFEVKNKRSKL
jgi:SET domain-containing protein